MKIAVIDREILHIFWPTWRISMKFSGKMLLTLIKVTKSQGFTLALEDTFFKKPQTGQIALTRALLGLINGLFPLNLTNQFRNGVDAIWCNFAIDEIQCFELGIFSFNSCIYYLTRGFIASTRAFNGLSRAFNLPTRAFSLPTHAFNLATRVFSVLTREFELSLNS